MKKIIDNGKDTAFNNMARDNTFLHAIKNKDIWLHLYDWEAKTPVTVGHFINESQFLKKSTLSLDIAKRPTGGGIVFHNGDLAFSLLMSSDHKSYSNVLDSYHFVNSLVIMALEKAFNLKSSLASDEGDRLYNSFCMAKISKYDVVMNGKKVGGAAQRRCSNGFLHQGSIFLSCFDKEFYKDFLLDDILEPVVDKMCGNSFYVLGKNVSLKELEEAREQLKNALVEVFCNSSEL